MENGGVAESSNPSTLIKEAIHVISCGYEEKTAWGKEVGFCSTLCKTNGWDSCSFTKTSVNIILEDIISANLNNVWPSNQFLAAFCYNPPMLKMYCIY